MTKRTIISIIIGIIAFPILYLFSIGNFQLYHTLIEILICLLGLGTYLISSISFTVVPKSFIHKITPGILAYSIIILFHSLGYSGVGLITENIDNYTSQTWLIANYILAGSFLIAVIFRNKNYSFRLTSFLSLSLSSLFLILIYNGIFPTAYIEGVGTTLYKVISEYVIIIIFILTMIITMANKEDFDQRFYKHLLHTMIFMVLAEFIFSLFDDTESIYSFVGHYFKLISFSILFYTIVVINLSEPYTSMFKSLVKERDEQEKLKHIANSNQERLERSQELAKVGSWELFIKEKVIWASPQAFEIYGLETTEKLLIDLVKIQKMVDKEYRQFMDKALIDLISKDIPYDIEFSITDGKGNKKYINSRASLERNEEGKPYKVLGAIQDITKLKEREKELIFINYHDYLTKLYNRRYFEAELKRLDVKRNLPISLIMGDLNGLKLINDSFGHSKGDELLIKVASVIKNTLRDDEIIARIGGDEFVVLLTNTSKSSADNIVSRINDNLSLEKVGNISLSVSFGTATKTDIKQDINKILKESEDAMYRSKLMEAPSVRSNTINAMMTTLYEKDLLSEEHSNRVSEYAYKLANALELSSQKVNDIKTAGLLHDIGKITISNEILNKKDKLTEEEYNEIKKHSDTGFRILYSIGEMSDIAEFILYHHERIDGKGYPKGLKGNEIPIESKILTICDSYDAMTSYRHYRDVLTKKQAIDELRKCSNTQFDKELTEVFINKVLLNKKE